MDVKGQRVTQLVEKLERSSHVPYHPIQDTQHVSDIWNALSSGQPVEQWDDDLRTWHSSYADLRYQDIENGYWRVKPDNNQHPKPDA